MFLSIWCFIFFLSLEIDMKDETELRKASAYGSALGPDWSLSQSISGASKVRLSYFLFLSFLFIYI